MNTAAPPDDRLALARRLEQAYRLAPVVQDLSPAGSVQFVAMALVDTLDDARAALVTAGQPPRAT